MKYLIILVIFILAACTSDGQIRSDALGGAIGGGAGAAIGSEIGGRKGAIIGGAIGGATGAVIVSNRETSTVKVGQRDEEYERHDNGRHRGHHKHKHKKKHDDEDEDEDEYEDD